jgi:hypothetical protein
VLDHAEMAATFSSDEEVEHLSRPARPPYVSGSGEASGSEQIRRLM